MADDSDPELDLSPPESVPSSVKKSHREAEIAEKEAGEYIPIEELEALADEFERKAEINWGRDAQSALTFSESELRELIAEYRSGADE